MITEPKPMFRGLALIVALLICVGCFVHDDTRPAQSRAFSGSGAAAPEVGAGDANDALDSGAPDSEALDVFGEDVADDTSAVILDAAADVAADLPMDEGGADADEDARDVAVDSAQDTAMDSGEDVAADVAVDAPLMVSCDAPPEPTFVDDGETDEDMVWTPIEGAAGRSAVCNDGSPAGYYIRRGAGEGLGRWVIFLEGGTVCATPDMCDGLWERVPRLMSSLFNPETRDSDGILSVDPEANPDFHHANHVYVPYCSMDYWSGDGGPSEITGRWHFRGARIVQAVIADLANPALTATPNLAFAELMVLVGSCAGGVGVMAHLDRVAEQLPCASVRGLNDGGWGVNFDPYTNTVLPVDLAATYAQGVWSGVVDADCADAQGLDGMCFFADVAAAHVTTPLFTYVDQRDGIQLGALGLSRPYDEDERAYMRMYQAALRGSLEPLAGAYSPLNGAHTIADRELYRTFEREGVTLQDAFTNWAFGREGPTRIVEE